MFVAKLRGAALLLVVLFLTQNLFSQSRGSRENFAGLVSSYIGHGVVYNYFFNQAISLELQYATASSSEMDTELSTTGTALLLKYFPFETQNIFVNAIYMSNNWTLKVTDVYEGSNVEYEMERKWGTGSGVGFGIDAFGSSKAFFGGAVGLSIVSVATEEDEFTDDGTGTDEQKKEASEKYDRIYSGLNNYYHFYITIGYRF